MTNQPTDPAPSTAIVDAPSATPRSQLVKRRTRRRMAKTIIGVGAGIVLLAGVIIGAITVSEHLQRQEAVKTANASVHTLAMSEISNESARIDLDAAMTAAQQYSAAVVPIVAAAPAYLDADGAAALEQARAALDAAVTAMKTPPTPDTSAVSAAFDTPKVTRIATKHLTAAQATQMTQTLTDAAGDVDADTALKRAAIDALTDARDVVDDALGDVARRVVTANAPAVRAAAPNVDQAVLEQAVTALQISIDDADPLFPTLGGYIEAAKTVLDGQIAFNVQAAIDAANAAGNDTFVDPSTGESKPNPNYNGGGSGSGSGGGGSTGGGGGSGADSGSDGGGSSGGGATAPTPPRIVYSSYACGGAGGYAESSYNNRGISVPGSGVASINGPYDSGSGWRVDWTCS